MAQLLKYQKDVNKMGWCWLFYGLVRVRSSTTSLLQFLQLHNNGSYTHRCYRLSLCLIMPVSCYVSVRMRKRGIR